MNKERRQKWNRQITYQWKLLTGSATRRVNFDALHNDAAYRRLRDKFLYSFKLYTPQEWEPLHSCYTAQELPLPAPHVLNRQAAELAAEFVLILDKVYKQELSPSFLAPLVAPEEIDAYVELTQRYLEAINKYETWPLGYFYGVAAQVLKIKEATSTVSVLLREESLPVQSLQPVGA